MELKNAGFDNTEESRNAARHLLVDGNSYRLDDWVIYFSHKHQAFRIDVGEKNSLSVKDPIIADVFQWMHKWQVEVDWKESLSPENPRWCMVWGRNTEVLPMKVISASGDPGWPYIDITNCSWEQAEPLSDELAALLDAEVGK